MQIQVIRADETWQQAGAYYVRIQGMARQHGIPLRREFDEHDTPDTKYIVLTDDEFPVATCRLYRLDEAAAMIGRVVVLPEYRGQGLGRRVVDEAESWLRDLGFARAVVESRDVAVEFYQKLGYTVTSPHIIRGDTFDCVRMEKSIIDPLLFSPRRKRTTINPGGNGMTFESLRAQYPVFRYDAYHIDRTADEIVLSFDFSVPGLCVFHPQTRIPIAGSDIVNAFDSETAHAIVFALGLTETVSYWKATCSPVIEVACGSLTPAQKAWWKTLWFNGLGEFFYRNGIKTDADSFVDVRCGEVPCVPTGTFHNAGLCLVPVGGGKDSAVTLSLLHDVKDKIRTFTVNDQQARTDTVLAAGLSADCMVRTYRTIDPELLRLNREGFLNGHTPFSAIVAFLSLYCAYLIGAEYIVLSNESSANESNIAGTDVNHQYSKSYAFERDFTDYVRDVIGLPVRYFSLLRPFNEMQIAKQFAALPQYHAVFKSCNAGSKQNVWCRNCAKCLFVYCILSPFLSEEQLTAIFGENLLDKASLQADFDGLCGLSDVKPFECIGTVREVCAALQKTTAQYKAQGRPLPALLRYVDGKLPDTADDPLNDFNAAHNVPPAFQSCVKEMLRFVRAD